MSTVINVPTFIQYADRIASNYKTLAESLAIMSASGSYFGIITNTNAADIEIPMADFSDKFDNYISGTKAATEVAISMHPYTDLITSLEKHLQRTGLGRTWDAYCSASGVRVSDYTNQIHYAKHRRYMNARNVFSEEEASFGTVEVNPSGVIFTDGESFGTGSSREKADGEHFAAARVKALLLSDISSPLVVNLIGLKEDGTEHTIRSVPISGSNLSSIEIHPSGRFVDITDVTMVSGGTSGDKFIIKTIKEREVL